MSWAHTFVHRVIPAHNIEFQMKKSITASRRRFLVLECIIYIVGHLSLRTLYIGKRVYKKLKYWWIQTLLQRIDVYPIVHTSCILTHWGRDKMAVTSHTILSSAFSCMKMLEFRLKFQWSLFLRVQLTISEPMLFCLLTQICVIRPQWVKRYLPGTI